MTREQKQIEAVKWHFAARNSITPSEVSVTVLKIENDDFTFRVQYKEVDKIVTLPLGYVESLTSYLSSQGWFGE